MQHLFTAGTSRGGTGIHTNILNTNKVVKIAQDPFLALWTSYRDELALKNNLKDFTPKSPLDEYYFHPEKIFFMNKIIESNLNIAFEQKNLNSLKNDLSKRIHLSSGLLKERLNNLEGNTYKDLLDSALSIVDKSLPGVKTQWLGFNENWCVEFFNPLSKAYPKSKFIIYFRDIRAAIASHLKLFEKHPDFPSSIALVLSFARAWRKHVAYAIKYSSLKSFKNRLLCLRYEDLIYNPESQVEKICNYLHIDYSDNMLKTENFKSSDGGKWYPNSNHKDVPQSGIFKQSVYKWEETLDKSILELIEYICAPELNLLGYKLKSNLGNNFPEEAYKFHSEDNLNCTGWRTDNKDPLRDFAYESLRRKIIASKIEDEILIKSCFLFPEVYNQLHNKKLSITNFNNFDLI